jgi:hypothetical protein
MTTFIQRDAAVDAVRVKATDFNGKSFDGVPFSDCPQWLSNLIIKGSVAIAAERGRDYAVWDVSVHGGILRAEPGDWIVRDSKGVLHVYRDDCFAAAFTTRSSSLDMTADDRERYLSKLLSLSDIDSSLPVQPRE